MQKNNSKSYDEDYGSSLSWLETLEFCLLIFTYIFVCGVAVVLAYHALK